MKPAHRVFSVRRTLGGLTGRREGTAAVEFAIILPVALLIMSLVVYGGQVYGVQRKVTLAATTVANLVAQGNNNNSATITSPQLAQILAYPNLILFPNNPIGVTVVITELQVTTSGGATTGKVVGSWASPAASQRACNSQMSVSADVAAALGGSSNYVVLGEVYYPFQPMGLYMALPAMTLHDSILMVPRTAKQITGPSGGAC